MSKETTMNRGVRLSHQRLILKQLKWPKNSPPLVMFGLNIAVLSFLKVFWADNCSFSRLITKYAIVLQFTTALLSTSCDNVLLQFTSAWLLQFSTTVITFYDRYYNFRHYYNPRLPSLHGHGIISFPPQCEKSSRGLLVNGLPRRRS